MPLTETIGYDFHGGKQMAEALRQLPGIVARGLLAESLIAGAVPLRDVAQARARLRRGPRRRPESVPLADTIRIFWNEEVRGWRASVDVGTKSPIAHLREFGHRMVIGGKLGRRHLITRGPNKGQMSQGGGRIVGQVPAYPFLRPAADETAEESVRTIGDTLGPAIEAEFAKRAPHEHA